MAKVVAFIILTLFAVQNLASPIHRDLSQEEILEELSKIIENLITPNTIVHNDLPPLVSNLRNNILETNSKYEDPIKSNVQNLQDKLKEIAAGIGEESKHCIDSATIHANTLEEIVQAEMIKSMSTAMQNSDLIDTLVYNLQNESDRNLEVYFEDFYYCVLLVPDPWDQIKCMENLIAYHKEPAIDFFNKVEKAQVAASALAKTTIDDLEKSLKNLLNYSSDLYNSILTTLEKCIAA